MAFLPLTGTTESSEMGLFGSYVLSVAGATASGHFSCIQVLEDCELTNVTSGFGPDGNPLVVNAADGLGVIENLVLPAGVIFRGYFSYVALASGVVVLKNMHAYGVVTSGGGPPPPPAAATRVTEDGIERVTEDGVTRILES